MTTPISQVATTIRELVGQGLLEDAIALVAGRWVIEGTVLRARLTLIERERTSGRITSSEHETLRDTLARDVLAELDELEQRDGVA